MFLTEEQRGQLELEINFLKFTYCKNGIDPSSVYKFPLLTGSFLAQHWSKDYTIHRCNIAACILNLRQTY